MAIIKPVKWMCQGGEILFHFDFFLSAQRAKMWAYRHFCHSSLICQARKGGLRHFKSLKSSTWYGQCREAIEKCSSLFSTAQWAKMGAYHQIFSQYSLISQARKVELRHFKSLKLSSWYGQCREVMDECSSLFSTAQWAKMWANWNIHDVKKIPTSDFVALE